MYIFISLNCTGASLTCDFAFDVSFSLKQFEKMIIHEITLMYPYMTLENNATYTFFKLNDVRLNNWSQQNIAYGQHPEWEFSMVIFNSHKKVNFNVKQYELSHSFHTFFVNWLKHLF